MRRVGGVLRVGFELWIAAGLLAFGAYRSWRAFALAAAVIAIRKAVALATAWSPRVVLGRPARADVAAPTRARTRMRARTRTRTRMQLRARTRAREARAAERRV